jgi:hypothetical protein
VILVENLGGFDVNWPTARLRHGIHDWRSDVQSDEIRLKVPGYFLDEGNGAGCSGRKIRGKQDVFKSRPGLGGSGFHEAVSSFWSILLGQRFGCCDPRHWLP